MQPGETWDSLARKFRIAKYLLKEANSPFSKTSPTLGSTIEVPIKPDLQASGIQRLEVTPLQPVQGQAAAFFITAVHPVTVAVRYAGGDLAPVTAGQGHVWALLGIHPLTTPGLSWLDVDVQGLELPAWLRSEPDDPVLHLYWPLKVLSGSFETQHLVLPTDKSDLLNPKLVADERTKLNIICCLLYTSPSPRDRTRSRMPSSA